MVKQPTPRVLRVYNGGINLQRQDFEEAERHYELAAQYPLRSANDHVAALVHVANINIRLGNFEKAKPI